MFNLRDLFSNIPLSILKGGWGKPKKSDPWNRGGSLSHYRGWQKPQFKLTKHKKRIIKARHASLIVARDKNKRAKAAS